MPPLSPPSSSFGIYLLLLSAAARSASAFAGETTASAVRSPRDRAHQHVSRPAPPLRPLSLALCASSSPILEEDHGSEGKILSNNERNWLVRFQQLQEYKDRYGNCNVPTKWEENPQLGTWANNQRSQYRKLQQEEKSSMTEERIEKMNSIGFIWDPQDAAWELRYEQLQEYKDRFGNCNVPTKWEENPQLGPWVVNQRTYYRKLQKGKKTTLTDERVEKLNNIGFQWSVPRNPLSRSQVLPKDWLIRYEQLKEYKDRFGHCQVPRRWEENPQLGRWVKTQRWQYHRYQDGLDSFMKQSKIDKLNELEFEWFLCGPLRNSITQGWLDLYEQLQKYKDRFGNCNVPQKWEENPQLASWVHTQRAEYRKLQEGEKSSMTEERIEKLNAIGFIWDALDAAWELPYEQLQEYKDRFGHCNVPQKWEEDPQLGKWVMTQRYQYHMLQEGKKSQMTEERIEKLNAVGLIWSLQRRRTT